jgi:hypothetical protein
LGWLNEFAGGFFTVFGRRIGAHWLGSPFGVLPRASVGGLLPVAAEDRAWTVRAWRGPLTVSTLPACGNGRSGRHPRGAGGDRSVACFATLPVGSAAGGTWWVARRLGSVVAPSICVGLWNAFGPLRPAARFVRARLVMARSRPRSVQYRVVRRNATGFLGCVSPCLPSLACVSVGHAGSIGDPGFRDRHCSSVLRVCSGLRLFFGRRVWGVCQWTPPERVGLGSRAF